MGIRSRAGLALVLALAVAAPASAARVTSVSVTPTHIVGGTTQQASATITVAFEPGENVNAPYEWSSYHIYSVVLAIDDADHWGQGYFYCFNYVPIGSNSVTCQIPQHWAVPVSETHTLLARAGNINYPPGGQYNNDPGMTTTLTVDPAPGTLRVTTNLNAATFTLNGPATYSGSGRSFFKSGAPPGAYTIIYGTVPGYVTPPSQTLTLPSAGSVTFSGSYVAQPTLRVRASLDIFAPDSPSGVPLPATAHVPLGAFLHVEAIDQQGQAVASNASLGQATVMPDVAPKALFKDRVLVRLTADDTSSVSEYQAIHKGTVTIAITPVDGSPGGTLTVQVEDPLRLGDAVNDIDAEIVKMAHRYGVPPDIIKGHAEKESSLNRIAYRYEPIGGYGDLRAVSRGQNLRTKAVFEDYRLATLKDSVNGPLAEGSLLTADDRDVRNVYDIECKADGTAGRPLAAADTGITAWEIFRCNDARQGIHWTARARPNGAARGRQLKADLFTGQTNLAASFGLLQMTFVTAITEQGWKGDAQGNKNPSLLLDTVDAHQRSAGSLDVGTLKVAKDFHNAVVESSVDSLVSMLLAYAKAYHRYNVGELGYGGDVVSRLINYFPVPRVAVLGGGQ